jgi:hypothetical protein
VVRVVEVTDLQTAIQAGQELADKVLQAVTAHFLVAMEAAVVEAQVR